MGARWGSEGTPFGAGGEHGCRLGAQQIKQKEGGEAGAGTAQTDEKGGHQVVFTPKSSKQWIKGMIVKVKSFARLEVREG